MRCILTLNGLTVFGFCGRENISMIICIGIGTQPSPAVEGSGEAKSSSSSSGNVSHETFFVKIARYMFH